MQSIIYTIVGLVAGFLLAWLIRGMAFTRIKKAQQDTQGFLEREKLGKERLQREMEQLYQREADLGKKLEMAQQLNKQMDADIILLQKSNEETESLLNATEPEVYALKLKLIEANNTIARMKSKG